VKNRSNTGSTAGAVSVQTNDAAGNEIIVYARAKDGSLARLGSYEAGGRGSGEPHLPSESSVVLSDDGRWWPSATEGAFGGVPETVAGLAAS